MSGNTTADADSVSTAETPDEIVETGPVAATATAGEAVKTEQTTATVTVGSQAPPKFIPPNFERMPPELKALKNWLLWAPSGPEESGPSVQFRLRDLVQARLNKSTGPPSTR